MSSSQAGPSDFTPRFSPFQSAQPRSSLFGGPSSQDVELESYDNTKLEGDENEGDDEEEEDDFDAFLRQQPLIDNDVSDDETYDGSEDESGSDDDAAGHKRTAPKRPAEETLSYRPARRNIKSTEQRKNDFSNLHLPETKGDSDSLSPLPEYRPNRFRGPEFSWRRLTAGDRMTAEALETARCRDLAAHLYNAYALRVRARRIAEGKGVPKELDEDEPFVPSKAWTSWPMHANEVPRVDEHLWRHGDGAFRMPPDLRPSAELEEEIMATMIRSAKERFQGRESDEPALVSLEDHRGKADTDPEMEKSDPESGSAAELRPVVQADDEKAKQLLRPITRNILTQFDDLLIGLHHSRKGMVFADDSSASEWLSDADDAVSFSNRTRLPKTAKKKQSKGGKGTPKSSAPPTPPRHSTKRARSSSETSRSGSPSSDSSLPEKSTENKKITGFRWYKRSTQRDWSDVLGIAGIQGWSQSAVMRAANRCSDLFGEDMAFRTFKEGQVEQVEDETGPRWEYIEADTEEEEDEKGEERPLSTPAPPPPMSLPQTSRSRSRAVSKERGLTPFKAPSGPENQDGEPQPSGKRPQRKKEDLICPVDTCKRHRNGFSRTWNLNLHMKRMHGIGAEPG